MILQALKEYYDRKAADPESGIAPLGWGWQPIPFVIHLSKEGAFWRIEDTRDGNKAKTFLVPILGESKGSGVKSNFPWENAEYIFGIPVKEDKKGVVSKRKEAFRKRLEEYISEEWAKAILIFLENIDSKKVNSKAIGEKYPKEWARIKKGDYLLFAIEGDPVTNIDSFRQSYNLPTGDETICLATGDRDTIKEIEPPIKGSGFFKRTPKETIKTELHIVSFNKEAFTSFGKKQGFNAPIGQKTSFAYANALNYLLRYDSRQKMQVGDATMVFWSERTDDFEDAFASFFAAPPKDNPDAQTEAVSALLRSPQTGVGSFSEDATRFYVLGLSPNAARLSVRFWHVGTVAEMAGRFRDYFSDLEIVHGPKEKDHLSLWRLLVSTAVQGKSENIAPNLAGNVMRSILEGLPFPETLLQSVLMRIKADHGISYPCAKLIKGFLNRKWRMNNPNQERMLTVSLNTENNNIGYRLGRLFAVLERVQESANPGINATIKDRFYAAASSAPVTVFGNLMRLAQNHLSKLGKEKPGYRINLEKLLQEVLEEIVEFPAHLSLDAQGQFAIGYYHQRQSFFDKKDGE